MYEICVTNRHLVKGDFLAQIRKVAAGNCDAIILREKDLTEEEYEKLAEEVLAMGRAYGKPVILHTFFRVAIRLHADGIHLPLPVLRTLKEEEKSAFIKIGASVHSVEEAKEAVALGATYLTAGHVFATDCKKGLAPRGLAFLKEVCESVPVPVYAIGGINEANAQACIDAGAAGVCRMSGFMQDR